MRPIFYPESIAVIGVSLSPNNLGVGIIYNLTEFNFRGVIHEVGPKGGIISGRRIYKSVLDIPDMVDLAVILTPARVVADVLEECGQKGIRWAVVESAGFREYGEEGKKLEERMVQVAEKWGMRFVGPNCIGVINRENGLCTPFTPLNPNIQLGDISMISQSGGVGMSVLNLMGNEGLGLNKFVSAGNMLNIQTEEFLEYFIEDPATRYIYLHLEGIRNGRKLMEVARRSPKPILASKANIGKFGKSIASSHTASLSSDDRIVDAAFRQCGIIRINDGTTLGNDLKVLHLPPMRGRNLAIISRSGGHAVIAADACEAVGLNLAEFPRAFLEEIEKHFRASVIRLTNPLDLGDLFDLDFFLRIIERTLSEEGVDGIVFLHTIIPMVEGPKSRELLARIRELSQQYKKPVAVYVSTEDQEVAWLKRNLNYPIFTQVVETVRALDLNYRYYAGIEQTREPRIFDSSAENQERARLLLRKAQEEKRDLFLHEAGEVLKVYGLPMIQGLPVADEEEAVKAARQLGFPVAMKIISKEISHKSDLGGVQLNLRTEAGVADAYRDMLQRIRQAYPEAKIEGVLIQPMATGGRELIIGGRQDDQFGPVILVGLGGIFVEVFGEVSLRVAPITPREAREMINELRGIAMFKGARGTKPSDLEAVAEVLLKLSQLLCDLPEIREIDINPLRVFLEKEGCLGLDVRMILDKS